MILNIWLDRNDIYKSTNPNISISMQNTIFSSIHPKPSAHQSSPRRVDRVYRSWSFHKADLHKHLHTAWAARAIFISVVTWVAGDQSGREGRNEKHEKCEARIAKRNFPLFFPFERPPTAAYRHDSFSGIWWPPYTFKEESGIIEAEKRNWREF